MNSIKRAVEEFTRYDPFFLRTKSLLMHNQVERQSSTFCLTIGMSVLACPRTGLTVRSGVFSPPLDAVTEQGYDLQFGVNMLGAYMCTCPSSTPSFKPLFSGVFYFTDLLIPTLTSTFASNPEFKPRVINTASLNHTFVNGLKFDTFKDGPKRRKMSKMALYSQSKFVSPIARTRHAD